MKIDLFLVNMSGTTNWETNRMCYRLLHDTWLSCKIHDFQEKLIYEKFILLNLDEPLKIPEGFVVSDTVEFHVCENYYRLLSNFSQLPIKTQRKLFHGMKAIAEVLWELDVKLTLENK